MKWWLIILMGLVTLSIVSAADEICPNRIELKSNCTMITPFLNCNNYTYTIANNSGDVLVNTSLTNHYADIYKFNFTQGAGEYQVQLCDGTTRQVIVKGDDEMAGLAIVIFILVVTGTLFILPFKIKKFADNKFLNATLKGLAIVLSLFLLALSTTITVSIADFAGLGINDELFLFLWIITRAAYIGIVIVVLKFGYDMVREWRLDNKKRSMGEEGEE